MELKATYSVVWDTKSKDTERLIKLRVSYNRTSHYYSLDSKTKLTREQFDNKKLKITKIAFEEADDAINKAKLIIEELGNNFTFPRFAELYKDERYGRRLDKTKFSCVAEEYIETQNIQLKTKKQYRTAMNRLLKYKPNLELLEVDLSLVNNFISSLKREDRPVSENTIRIYLRDLRCLYEYALKKKYARGSNPFSNIPNQPLTSIKRENMALEEDSFREFLKYHPKTAQETMGKDFFFLSFHLCGANIGDILRLKNWNLKNDSVQFIRHKTQATRTKTIIALTKDAREILEKYGTINPEAPDEYVLPFISKCKDENAIENKIHDIISRINAGIKSISNEIHLGEITTYNARHTFATYARDVLKWDVAKISKSLGHNSIQTTEDYLGTLTQSFRQESKEQLEELMVQMMKE